MQKKLIALAIAGLSSAAAFAQSNVTVYGQVYTSFEQVKATGASTDAQNLPNRSQVTSNSSYIGFKGAESLGNGMTAVFQIENTISSDVGGWTNNRDTYLGVAGGFGTVAAGLLTGPYRGIGAKMDVAPAATTRGFSSLMGQLDGVRTTVDDRTGNVLAYISPNFSGFQATVAYSANEAKSRNTGANQNDPLWTVGLTYENGPFYVGYAHVDAKDKTVTGAVGAANTGSSAQEMAFITSVVLPYSPANVYNASGALVSGPNGIGLQHDKLKADRLAGKYSAANWNVGLLWDRQKLNLEGATANTFLKRDVWELNGSYTFGANYIYAMYSHAGNTKTDGTTIADSGANQWTLGYAYNMSKRTSLNAYYTRITNKASGAYDFYVNQTAPGFGADPQALGVGIRHTF